MIIKAIEIRDVATFIPAIAVGTLPDNEGQRYLLARCGYPRDGTTVVLMKLSDQKAASDPYDWDSSTMNVAHVWIEEHFAEIVDGQVVDVEFILGKTAAPKQSERDEVLL